MPTRQYWLFKSEPETYSFDRLLQDGKTNWNDVRNFQARNFLRTVKKGDWVLIYHSGGDKCVVGLAEIIKEAYPDPDPADLEGGRPDWVQADLKPMKRFLNPVSLKDLKATPALKNLLLIKQSRLSCMPVTENEFETIKKMGGLK